ncbi:MAG TPA: hypothetical protein VNJ70_01525 [Thermoanaerobaculia bacterium]|nr:hypothetical protein [Thermoanaerobaculia bacterium]
MPFGRRRDRRERDSAPTMIVPAGARIGVDPEGQLCIQSPGNLVLQNSGRYGTLESLHGSVRVERGVQVEAVTVRCAETCYVEGTLTAWKVVARSLQLEDGARANVVLQETQRLEVGRGARLVGNFSSERELFGFFSRFAHQVRSLPFGSEGRAEPAAELPATAGAALEEERAESPSSEPEEFPESLILAMVLLERELERHPHEGPGGRAIAEIAKLLQERDLETLRLTRNTLFGRIDDPGEDAARAQELVEAFYTGEGG